MCQWIRERGVEYVGIPPCHGYGYHLSSNEKIFRYFVMEQLDKDLWTHFKDAIGRFCHDTICYLALRLVSDRILCWEGGNITNTDKFYPYIAPLGELSSLMLILSPTLSIKWYF